MSDREIHIERLMVELRDAHATIANLQRAYSDVCDNEAKLALRIHELEGELFDRIIGEAA